MELWLEADHFPPASAEVYNEWSYTSAAPYALMASTATTFPFLLIQLQSAHLRGLMRFSLSSYAYSDLLATFCNISFVNGHFETRYM